MSISVAHVEKHSLREAEYIIDMRIEESSEQMPLRRGLCLVIVAPSGCGKTSIMEAILAADPAIKRSISATTRSPRNGEKEGIHYFFKTHDEFDGLVENGGMLEHAYVHRNRYGIPRAPVEDALAQGVDVVFVIDWKGHATLCDSLPGDVVGIFLLPPSMAELERRLRSRGDLEGDIDFRLKQANEEILHWKEFPYVVVNDDLIAATSKVAAILEAERHSSTRSVSVRLLAADMAIR